MRKILVIFDREKKLYFAGFVGEMVAWAQKIEAALPYDSQKQADEDYDKLKTMGFEVMVQG